MSSYILATTETIVRWYGFDPFKGESTQFELLKELDLAKIPQFADKESAKKAALSLGLQTWRYFKF